MPQINVDARIDENGLLCVKMPSNLAGTTIKGKFLYQSQSQSLQNSNIDIDNIRRICQEIRNLPNLDSRSPDEIIGYNDFGIPE